VISATPDPTPTGGELVIQGFGFGEKTAGVSKVHFSSVPNMDAFDETNEPVAAKEILSWSDKEIIVRVPVGAKSGPMRVVVDRDPYTEKGDQRNSNLADLRVEGTYDPDETREVDFSVSRMVVVAGSSTRQYCQDYTIQILRDNQVIETGTSQGRNGEYTTTLKVDRGYTYVVNARYTMPPGEQKVYGSYVVQSDRDNYVDVRTSTSTASVSVSPSSITLPTKGTCSFHAAVTAAWDDTALDWYLLEKDGGSVTGMGPQRNTGFYRAPAAPGTYHVQARSKADPSVYATATVHVTDTVTIDVTPSPVRLPTGGTVVFTATVLGATDPTVIWIDPVEGEFLEKWGTGDSNARYQASDTPGIYTVTAMSNADIRVYKEVTVVVLADKAKTLTFDRSNDFLGDIPVNAALSGSVTVPVIVSADGQIVEPYLNGRSGPEPDAGLRVEVVVGDDPEQAEIAEISYTYSCTAKETSFQKWFSTWNEKHTVKKVSYETCHPGDQLPSGGWKLDCTAEQGFAGTVLVSSSGVWTNANLEMEVVKYANEDGQELARSTYTRKCGEATAGVSFLK
jgi:hypothetical protein